MVKTENISGACLVEDSDYPLLVAGLEYVKLGRTEDESTPFGRVPLSGVGAENVSKPDGLKVAPRPAMSKSVPFCVLMYVEPPTVFTLKVNNWLYNQSHVSMSIQKGRCKYQSHRVCCFGSTCKANGSGSYECNVELHRDGGKEL